MFQPCYADLYAGPVTTPAHQGATLGLPPSGPGSVAPLGRRALALLVDWLLCQLIAVGLLGMQWGQVSGTESFIPLGVLFVENVLLVPTVGTTLGHRLLGLRVVAVDGDGTRPPALVPSAWRALLLCLFVPAMIMDADTRGLHDKAARSVVVRTR
ncbi:RDD family protein [Ornithinimicrobium tianjinense]|uniref:RDD family protein n=1 Tax=Ornithinimicrobium tianjinense TaxID=1195761 RepID=A0A917BI35_9MICO|nr:RDD family protein [Ornithinimicrobium tianjinense]